MSVPQTSVSVLIPACNEEGALANTIAAIEKHRAVFGEMEILVINDGSSDRTGEVTGTIPVTLIEDEASSGYGGSLHECIPRATGDQIARADGDGTHALADRHRSP